MKIAISAETTADLTKELLNQRNIKIVTYNILLGDQTFADGEITTEDIIDFVNKNKILPKTSAINEYTFIEHFESLLKDYDAVIHFSLSSKLSCACENAMKAADKLGNVYVIDSQSLSTGIGLLALYGCDLVEQGLDVKEVYEKCLKRVASVQASFALKRVDYLYKGGRCSVLSFLGANLLRICPQIIVKEGKMIAGKKYRGNYKHVVENYCHDVLEEFKTPDLTRAFVTYTTATEDVIEVAVESLKAAGFKDVYVTRAGGTITSHCGENCLGILYLNDGNKN